MPLKIEHFSKACLREFPKVPFSVLFLRRLETHQIIKVPIFTKKENINFFFFEHPDYIALIVLGVFWEHKLVIYFQGCAYLSPRSRIQNLKINSFYLQVTELI